jgi:hypothetical protein
MEIQGNKVLMISQQAQFDTDPTCKNPSEAISRTKNNTSSAKSLGFWSLGLADIGFRIVFQ